MSECNLSSNFFIRNQEFVIFYYSTYCRLYAVVNRKLVYIKRCINSEDAKYQAKIWRGEE